MQNPVLLIYLIRRRLYTLAILFNVWLIIRNLHTLAILYNVWLIRRKLIRRKPPHHVYIHYNVCLMYVWLLGTSTPWLYFVTYVWSVETWSIGASTLAILYNVWLIVRNLLTLAILYNVWLIRRKLIRTKPPHHVYIHYNVCLIRRNLHPWHDWIQIVVFQKGRDLWSWNFCQL